MIVTILILCELLNQSISEIKAQFMEKVDFLPYAEIVNMCRLHGVNVHSIRFMDDIILIVLDDSYINPKVFNHISEHYDYIIRSIEVNGEAHIAIRLRSDDDN